MNRKSGFLAMVVALILVTGYGAYLRHQATLRRTQEAAAQAQAKAGDDKVRERMHKYSYEINPKVYMLFIGNPKMELIKEKESRRIRFNQESSGSAIWLENEGSEEFTYEILEAPEGKWEAKMLPPQHVVFIILGKAGEKEYSRKQEFRWKNEP